MSFDWSYVASLFVNVDFWSAVLTVAELSVAAWVIGVVCGFFLALGKLSTRGWLHYPARIYIWFFRSVPLLVLLIFIYNLPQLAPATSIVLSGPFTAGLIAMALSESAYIAEIHRGGLLSVPDGQREAGYSLGLGFFAIQRKIIIPQAIRIALPTLSNQYVTIVKLTSLVSVISLTEILFVGQQLYTTNFKVLETMLAVAVYYVFIVTVADFGLKRLERSLDVTRHRGDDRPSAAVESVDWERDQHSVAVHDRDNDGPALELIGLAKRYGQATVLADINLTINAGQVISVIGPSGSGKTTLIRAINGMATPDAGEVRLSGQTVFCRGSGDTSPKRQMRPAEVARIGMVFQDFQLFPHRTVLDNLLIGPIYHRIADRRTLKRQALGLLGRVGMTAHARKYPHQLSGGQKQRVAIARALAMQPEILVFDEPTSALDPELIGDVLAVIESLSAEGLTILIVTHEMRFAFGASDEILFMEHGLIADSGAPATLKARSAESRIGRFLGDIYG